MSEYIFLAAFVYFSRGGTMAFPVIFLVAFIASCVGINRAIRYSLEGNAPADFPKGAVPLPLWLHLATMVVAYFPAYIIAVFGEVLV